MEYRVNTKATGYTPLEALKQLAPADIRREIAEKLKCHKHYASGSKAMVIHSDEHRSQNDNRRKVIQKRNNVLREIVVDIVSKQVHKGPPKQL